MFYQEERTTVEARNIGELKVSVVGLGCNNFGGRLDQTQTTAVVKAALDAEINFFDTADIYGNTHSEEFLGKALGSKRDEVIVASKFSIPYEGHTGGASPQYIPKAIESSLRRLGTDYIDLYQLHFPDPAVPIEETLGALGVLVAKGMVREIGCSNFTPEMMQSAFKASKDKKSPRFVSVQNHYNLLHREPELGVLAECKSLEMAFLPYFPLENGLLTGKYQPGKQAPSDARLATLSENERKDKLSDERLNKVVELNNLANESGHSVLELSIAWLLSRQEVASVISGATKPEQVIANVKSAKWTLDPSILTRIDEISPIGS